MGRSRAVRGRNRDLPLTGGRPERLDIGGQPVRWATDGRSLSTAPPATVPTTVERVDLDFGSAEAEATLQPPDPAGLVQVSPVRVVADGEAYAYRYHRRLSTLFVVAGLQERRPVGNRVGSRRVPDTG